jgi:DNA-binding FadR family transcriptional regulator
MAIIPPLKLTRDQLASFLQDFEQIKQFENLFATVQTLAPIVDVDFQFQAATASATANEALALISALTQEAAINSWSADSKAVQALALISALTQQTSIETAIAENRATQALNEIHRITNSLELLALSPVRNNIELSHDVNGILPYANQTARVRSNQVLTWLSM